ncbi:uncharacterized protein LOC100891091 [Strongylocentrotus purpuratus]|uniref:Uncharacterized protein n=1 Tax=Strongylocentrotus purpuratus TaxID=7668 RepID=A0A7M7LTL2_STRPU|nr:uncharacterized protein LOC100891091 [Strongylocentrotus purpuratus]
MSQFFFWSPEEAAEKQVLQIGASACGATGVINVLRVLDLPSSVEEVAPHINTRLRAEDAPVIEYLHSRSVAGTTHEELIAGLEKSSQSKVFARFFPFHPRRDVNLSDWLKGWMRQGVVGLATLNLQRAVPQGYQVPDAWHHQMIYGVEDNKIYMCNPVVAESHADVMEQLCSESVLLIRRSDIMKRYSAEEDLRKIEVHPDMRWREMKVSDQVYKIIDEDMAIPLPKTAAYDVLRDCLFTSHVTIPAAYQSGITLCVRQDNIEACQRLTDAKQLPILESRKNEEEEEVEVVITSKRTEDSASGAASLIP